ncbi:MAG: MptD family putative ECF transporter S component [Sporolactobacillus sp.]
MNPSPSVTAAHAANHLSVRDLSTIAIFSVLMTVVAIVIAIITSPTVYLATFVASPIIAFVTAPIYAFMLLKVHKRGAVFIYCLILAIIYLISGTPYLSPWLVIAGLLGELSMAGKHAYASMLRITASWMICTFFRATNGMIDIWFFTKQYLASGNNRAHFHQIAQFYYSVPWIITILLIALLAAAAGGAVSARLMKKHFLQNGLLK